MGDWFGGLGGVILFCFLLGFTFWFGLDVYCGGCLLVLYIHCLLVLLQGVGGFDWVGGFAV